MFIISIIGCIVLFSIVPMLVGRTIGCIFKLKKSVEKYCVIGMVSMFTFCGVVTVPVVVFKLSYLIVENVVVAFAFFLFSLVLLKGIIL